MLAEATESIPEADHLVYEPKWDGFRCIIFKIGDALTLSSRTGKPLQRYFPELVEVLQRALPPACVVDGEIVLPTQKGLDFETLQMRIHPAASRIERLSQEFPTSFVAFDLLALGSEDFRTREFGQRRVALESVLQTNPQLRVTPQTASVARAKYWFDAFEGAGCDGLIARDVRMPYCSGERVLWKIKHHRTADCVVAGFRESAKGGQVASLLLGLFDESHILHYIGHTASFAAAERKALHQRLMPLRAENPFVGGRSPSEQSRWKKEASTEPVWTAPTMVCEVRYDFLSGPRFRHASTFLRFRDDKPAEDCRFDQLLPSKPFSLDNVWNAER
jgi:ATP-dependent DNA ligase